MGRSNTKKTFNKHVASISPLEVGGLVAASKDQWGFGSGSGVLIAQQHS